MTQSTTLPPPAADLLHTEGWRDARALLAAAVDAFREGLAAAPPAPLSTRTDGQLNEELLAYVYGRLERSDQVSLAKLGSIRERALSLSRAGQQQEAEGTMKLARFFLSVAGFSPLGRAAADTLQHAAEGYLSYRRGDYADGIARMTAAVAATDRLADAWGESLFTTARRIHLLHNQMKVDVRRRAAREAVSLGAAILAHIAGSSVDPAFPALARPSTALEPAVAQNFCHIVGATIAEVLASVPEEEAKALLGMLDGMEPAESSADARVWAWIQLKSAALEDDPAEFLEAAVPFLRAGSVPAPTLFYAVALDVVRAAHALDAADAVAEIESALATDARVPKSLQTAARAAL